MVARPTWLRPALERLSSTPRSRSTALGSGQVAAAVVAVAAIFLLARREVMEGVTLLVGVAGHLRAR